MNADTRLLLRYVDREMSAGEAESFRARLAESPELSRRLREMQELGVLLRRWSRRVEARADTLVEPTLERVRRAERRRRQSWVACGLLLLPLIGLRASDGSRAAGEPSPAPAPNTVGAAIERVEASQAQAQVFVVGSAATPVVWLSDDDRDDEESGDQDPG